MFALLLIVAAILPVTDTVLRDTCDLIEINHFYDEQGRLVFDQAIFYDWSASDSRYHVRAWRLVKHPSQLPQREWPSGYSAIWQDGFDYPGSRIWDHKRGWLSHWQDGDVMRSIHADSFRETWTQYDPELSEREVFAKENRRELLPVEKRRMLRSK
jgi:hypothetical protein